LLLLPITTDADPIRFDVAVDFQISITGTVPLSGGDFVIDDTFTLRGAGSATLVLGSPPFTALHRFEEVGFSGVGGAVRGQGFVRQADYGDFGQAGSNLYVTTLAYELFGAAEHSFPDNFVVVVSPPEAFFSGTSHHALVRVGEETAELVGTASFVGTGIVPEPSSAMLLSIGAASVAVVTRRLARSPGRLIRRSLGTY
jgi:hypothetical protein